MVSSKDFPTEFQFFPAITFLLCFFPKKLTIFVMICLLYDEKGIGVGVGVQGYSNSIPTRNNFFLQASSLSIHHQWNRHLPLFSSTNDDEESFYYGYDESDNTPSSSPSPRRRGRTAGSSTTTSSTQNDNNKHVNNSKSNNSNNDPHSPFPPRNNGIKRPKTMIIRKSKSSAVQKEIEQRQQQAKVRHEQALQDPTLLSNVSFKDRTDLSPLTKRAITEQLGLTTMTEIQARTHSAVLAGDCVLGRARTGTGKTLAFLLPTIERLLETDLSLYKPGQSIGAIIIAPTRELAIQIAEQAELVLSYYNDMTVACIYGGTKIQRDLRLLSSGAGVGGSSTYHRRKLPTILVATPGRLLEHLDSSRIDKRKFSDIAAETQIVILDETDRLFEGFYRDTTKILSYLPRAEKRQTLLFSATFPPKLQSFLKESMKINFTYIDCVANNNNDNNSNNNYNNNNNKRVGTGDDADGNKGNSKGVVLTAAATTTTETNIRVDQTYHVLESMDEYITTLVKILQHAMIMNQEAAAATTTSNGKNPNEQQQQQQQGDNHHAHGHYDYDSYKKILVFFPASKLVRFFVKLFNEGLNIPVLEIHSRMSQSSRNKASSTFRSAQTAIMFTSDVSARGVDYPDVSLVIQYGAPPTADAYIHRLGRTGRAGRPGKGLLVLLPFERKNKHNPFFWKRISKLGIQQDLEMKELLSSRQEKQQQKIESLLESTRLRIRSGHVTLTPAAEAAYTSFLAYYMANNCKNNNNNGKNSNNSKKGLLEPREIVEFANQFALSTGLMNPPSIESKTISRLGIEGLVEEKS